MHYIMALVRLLVTLESNLSLPAASERLQKLISVFSSHPSAIHAPHSANANRMTIYVARLFDIELIISEINPFIPISAMFELLFQKCNV